MNSPLRFPPRGRDGAPPVPASFAAVARRLSRWTTNLLATGLILVLALGVGRQLIGWWRVEPGAAGTQTAADASLSGEAWLPSRLRFGDSPYEIEYRPAHGDRAAAIDQLAVACRELALSSAGPLAPPSEAERQLLAAVAELEPLSAAGSLRLYGSLYGVPLVVVVNAAGQGPVDPQTEPENPAESAPHALPADGAQAAAGALGASRDRVLVWGMAAAAGADDWSLYLFRQGTGSAPVASQRPELPLPPDCRRTLELGDARGETLLGIAGATGAAASADWAVRTATESDGQQADGWRNWFARELSRQGWSVLEDWRSTGPFWHARYRHGEGAERWTAELQFGPQSGGGLAGLVRIVPPPAVVGQTSPAEN